MSTLTFAGQRQLFDYADSDVDFYHWLAKADDVIRARAGVRLLDLPDYLWRDAFDAGDSPEAAALEALKDA